VVLVDSGGANLGSVRYALQRLGVEAPLAADAETLAAATHVILPGVGAAAPAMARLAELGLVEPLRALDKPLLGVCLGMQLLFEGSDEGDVECLGLVPGRVRAMQAAPGLRIPHMGWNRLHGVGDSPLLLGLPDPAYAYFVHGFAAPVGPDTVAVSEHGAPFSAMIRRGHLHGAQFHPERSAAVGAKILENFMEL
jgi:imidazole glycerol-phosphate synthase subunit HisH